MSKTRGAHLAIGQQVLSHTTVGHRVSSGMSTPDETPIPFPNNEERDALVLEFQRVTARLVRAGLLSRVSATRLARGLNHQRSKAEDVRHGLPKLMLDVLLAVEDGTLNEGVHVLHVKDGKLALHLESVAPALFKAKRSNLAARDMRRLFHFGWLHFREVVQARSERMVFGPEEDRRRTVILNLAKAYEFVGSRPPAVPSR